MKTMIEMCETVANIFVAFFVLICVMLLVSSMTATDKEKDQRFQKTSYDGHSYIVFYSSGTTVLLHDPNCHGSPHH